MFYRLALVLTLLIIGTNQGWAEYSSKENILVDDKLAQTDWGLWLTKYDEGKFDNIVFNPANELIKAMDTLETLRRGYRGDFSKKERRQLQNAIKDAHGKLICITEYPNVLGWPKLQMIVKSKKVLIPADLQFGDKRLRNCEDYLAVPEKPIVFENIDCIYYAGHCHLQWAHTSKDGIETMSHISFRFHYGLEKQIADKFYDLDLIRLSGAIHFLPDYWYRELPLTQITKAERIIEEAVVAERNGPTPGMSWASIDEMLKDIGNRYINNYYQKSDYNSGYFMVHEEESLNGEQWGQVAYQRAMALVPPPPVVPAEQLRKKYVQDTLTKYHMARFCVKYKHLTGFDSRYINKVFNQDTKNDLTQAEIDSFGVRELAALETMIRGNEGKDYCGLIQLSLLGGAGFFE